MRLAAGVFWLACAAAAAQERPAPEPSLRFAAASVKLYPTTLNYYMAKDYRHGPPYVIPTSSRFTDMAHVEDLVMEAYGVTESQIRYLPAWTLSPYGAIYQIEAEAAGDAPPAPAQFQEMLQALLADRFHLKVHWETKAKVSVYALVVDKNGPKFHEFRQEGKKDAAPGAGGTQPFAGTTLFALAHFLTANLENPVVDRTGLPAVAYDFNIDKLLDYRELDREENTDMVNAADYIRSTVPHELGLRLESRKESMDYLVVDRVDQPPEK